MDLSTIITFSASAISGIAGLFIHRYISRAKPTLNVTSLGFDGDVIEIDEEVQSLSRKCNWTDSISRYVSYDELSKFQLEVSQIEAALQQEKENVDKWMEHFLADGTGKQFSIGQMMRSPLIEGLRVFHPYLKGMLRRREVPELPTTLEELKALPDIFPLEITNEVYEIHCGNFAIPFRKKEYSEEMINHLELILYSISKGEFSNYMKIHEHFSSYAGSQLYNYQKIKNSVKEHLVSDAKLSLKVSISNLGQTPIIIKPYFAAKLVFGEKSKSMVLENIDKSGKQDEIPFIDIVRSEQYQNHLHQLITLVFSQGEVLKLI
ncbi:hypothetical protein [Agarivorans litoreus]|uniref:hypothetical protein n=1 Tax=Agarivorans litoreus TaxID=1510455 RepID=UPI001C7DB984|nr:hypothetical protein [Agarivorans litoreus]